MLAAPAPAGVHARSRGGAKASAPALAVLPTGGRPALVAPAFFGFDAVIDPDVDVDLYGVTGHASATPGTPSPAAVERLRRGLLGAAKHADARTALAKAASDQGLRGASLAVDRDGAVPGAERVIDAVLPGTTGRDCSQLMRLIRMVKAADEIDQMRTAAQISEDGALASFAALGAGCTPRELHDAFKSRIAVHGADFDHLTYTVAGLAVGSGRRADVRFEDGDTVAVDWGCVVGGYHSDTAATLSFGEPRSEVAAAHGLLARCIDEGRRHLRPGVVAPEAREAMSNVLTEAGIEGASPHGHGLGLEIRDLPILDRPVSDCVRDDVIETSAAIPLEPGMVVNLEASRLIPGVGGVAAERTFVVTPGGAEPLVTQRREHPFIAGQPDRSSPIETGGW